MKPCGFPKKNTTSLIMALQPPQVNKDVEIHLELLPFANPPQGIIDGKMLLNAAEKHFGLR